MTSPTATAWPIIPVKGSTSPSAPVASSKVSRPSATDAGVAAVDGQSFDGSGPADGVMARADEVAVEDTPLPLAAGGFA